jgi:hypothetical protein
MSDELTISGKNYVSSKRAASVTGYAQDYIGQLARSGHIDAQRVGGLWYVLLDSLAAYKTRTDDFKPQPPVAAATKDPESVVSFDGKDYISANRAAKVTGYNQDYIGQLARTGKVLSRQIGNRWYVDRAGLIAHKTEKDSLLAAVQRESVGLRTSHVPIESAVSAIVRAPSPLAPQIAPKSPVSPHLASAEPMLTYITENKDLLPAIKDKYAPEILESQRIPITIKPTPSPRSAAEYRSRKTKSRLKTAIKVVSALTIVVMLSYSIMSLEKNARFAAVLGEIGGRVKEKAQLAGASLSSDQILAALERALSRELVYTRAQ